MVGASDAAAGLAGLIVLVIVVGMYFLPTIVAAIRKVPNIGSVVVVNFLLGWTLIGWVVALAMAARSVQTVNHMSQYNVIPSMATPPPSPPPIPPPPPGPAPTPPSPASGAPPPSDQAPPPGWWWDGERWNPPSTTQ